MISVTTILDRCMEPELVAWRERVGPKKAEAISTEAKRVGSLVDSLVQLDLKTGSYRLEHLSKPEPEVACCMAAWEAFKIQQPDFRGSVKLMQAELTDGMVVGHPDFIVESELGWGIVDLKTSKAIQPKHWTQVVAYAYLRQAMEPLLPPPVFVAILRVDKATGQPEYQMLTEPTDFLYEWSLFQAYRLIAHHGEMTRERTRLFLEQEALTR